MTRLLQKKFTGREVLEIACGTSYWTEKIAATAEKIMATDINETVIKVAASKNYQRAKIDFAITDFYTTSKSHAYESLFGGFIWSHIPLQQLPHFISTVNQLVTKGGTVVLIDNNFVKGSNLSITHTDNNGNTYQKRTLEDGTAYNIIKNFPTEIFIKQMLEKKATHISFTNLQYYWIVQYTT